MPDEDKISYTTTQRVRYAETDAMGVVYYGRYFTFFEVGRVELLRSRGYSYCELEEEGTFLPVVEATCRYKKPLRFDDLLHITTSISDIGRTKLSFTYKLEDDEGNLLAEGETLHACINAEGKPIRISGKLADSLDIDSK